MLKLIQHYKQAAEESTTPAASMTKHEQRDIMNPQLPQDDDDDDNDELDDQHRGNAHRLPNGAPPMAIVNPNTGNNNKKTMEPLASSTD